MKTLICILTCMASLCAFSQDDPDSAIDSLARSRKLDTLPGRIVIYHSPGYADLAKELQETVTGAVTFYEKTYHVRFDLKVFVLDTTQWLKEAFPYGPVFYNGGHYLVLNTGMPYDVFRKAYNLEALKPRLDAALQRQGCSPDRMIRSRLKFTAIHELGHYFYNLLSPKRLPTPWTNEFSAWAFSYRFFKDHDPQVPADFGIFCDVLLQDHQPRSRTLVAFDTRYIGVGMPDFYWYHAQFFHLLKELDAKFGSTYMDGFTGCFSSDEAGKLKEEEILRRLDLKFNGVPGAWARAMEAKR